MQKKKTEKVIIVGQSGSGKDYLMRKLVEKGLKPCLKYTTRPKRKFEKQGITYNFTTSSNFTKLISENSLITYQTFEVTPDGKSPETWYYGISKEEFSNSQVFIMTPIEFSDINDQIRDDCFVVYLDISRDVREKRLSKREDRNDSVTRRLDSDEIDFKDFKDYDLRITDPEFSADEVYDLME